MGWGKQQSSSPWKEHSIFETWEVSTKSLHPESSIHTAKTLCLKKKNYQLLLRGMWPHLYHRTRGFFSDWKGPQTLSKPDMQISTGLEAQNLRESICGHIRILIEIESMTHGIQTAFL